MNGGVLKRHSRPVGVAAIIAHPRAAAEPALPPHADAVPAPVGAPGREAIASEAPAPAPDIESIRRVAHAEGLRQGQLEAQRQLEGALARQESSLQGLIRTVDGAVRARLEELEEFALAIAFEACGSVLAEASFDGRLVIANVKRLLQPLRQSGAVRVALHPGDLERVNQCVLGDAGTPSAVQFEADALLAPGDCRVWTAHGQLESGLSIQLAAISNILLATRAEIRARQEAPESLR